MNKFTNTDKAGLAIALFLWAMDAFGDAMFTPIIMLFPGATAENIVDLWVTAPLVKWFLALMVLAITVAGDPLSYISLLRWRRKSKTEASFGTKWDKAEGSIRVRFWLLFEAGMEFSGLIAISSLDLIVTGALYSLLIRSNFYFLGITFTPTAIGTMISLSLWYAGFVVIRQIGEAYLENEDKRSNTPVAVANKGTTPAARKRTSSSGGYRAAFPDENEPQRGSYKQEGVSRPKVRSSNRRP